MKVLIIGAGGFIGQHLSITLARAGAIVLAGHRAKAPSFDVRETAPVRSLRVDLQDEAALRDVLDRERPDTVVHLASGLVPGSSASEYLLERHKILDGTLKLILDLAERGTRLVYFSSGGAIYGASPAPAFTETGRCEPISFYGQSKLEIESLIRFGARTAGLRYLIVRPSNPYGGHQSLRGRQGVIGAILGCLLDARPLQVWGDGSAVRDYIHIDDLCQTVVSLIGAKTGDDIINVGSGVGHSLLEVIETVEDVTGRRLAVDFQPPRSVDVPRVVLDVSRARALGISPARPLRDGIRATVAGLDGFRT